MTSKPITELDFDQIKTALKTFLQGQDRFADFDYDGSNMAVILDVLAYNAYMQNFHSNMAIAEMFLDSAQLRSSVVSHAKELNYLPRSRRSSTALLDITFSPGDSPATITIAKGTKFNATIDGQSFTFSTDQAHLVESNNGVYQLTSVPVYEGRLEKEYFDVTTSSKYVISSKDVDTDSITVKVYDSSAANANSSTYIFKSNLFGLSATDKVFFLQPAKTDHYELTFGLDVFGKQPEVGQVIEVSYRISSADDPNGAETFTSVGDIDGYTPTVSTRAVATGGAVAESTSSIKFYAPKSIQIQDRAVTESDYINLLKNRFAEIESVSVYGGETQDPPQYGRVIVAVDVTGGDGVSNNAKERYRQFLKDRSPLSIEPVIVSPKRLYVEVSTLVFYNRNTTDQSVDSLKASVRAAIQTYNTNQLNDFGKTARVSRISRAIDDADPSIVSNDTELHLVFDLNPTLGTNTNFSIQSGNQLIVGDQLNSQGDLTTHQASVKSTNFTYQSTTSFIQDNGLGKLQILTNTAQGAKIMAEDIGTVDYGTGAIIIRGLNVSAFSGSAIKLYLVPEVETINSPKDRIISIRDTDVIVDVRKAQL